MRNNSKKEKNQGTQCTVCLERTANSTIDGCAHEFCLRCIKKWARTKNNCPLCRERFLRIQTRNRTIEVEPVPERVRAPRPTPPAPQPPQRSMYYMPMLLYPQPNCIFYPSQPSFFLAPTMPNMPSFSYPLTTQPFFMPQQ